MKKKSFLKVSILAIVVVLLILQVGIVSAEEPEGYRMRGWGLWQSLAYDLIIEIPPQDVPLDTWLTVGYTPYAEPVNGIWPIWTVFHINLQNYQGPTPLKEIKPDPKATICITVSDELLGNAEGNPYRLGIAKAEEFGWSYTLLRTRYDPIYNNICAVPTDINGVFTVIDKKMLGYY
jgi:hypothetical protein